MTRHWTLFLAVALTLGLGCTEKTTRVVEPPPPGPETISTMAEDENLRLTLWASFPTPDGGVFLGCEAKNIGTRTVRYVDGGCGCPTPSPLMRDVTGELCSSGPRPLCPCWTETRELLPGTGITHGEAWLCREGTASASFTYTIFLDGEWRDRTLEVELPVERERASSW